jgi:hypothetical protein
MTDKICLPSEHYAMIIIFFALMTFFYAYKIQNLQYNNRMKDLSQEIDILDDVPLLRTKKINIPKKESNLMVTDLEKRDFLERRDTEAVYNEFKPPEKRLPEHAYPDRYVRSRINVPTRGLPDNYQSVGSLVRKSDEKVLQLFGRQKYPGSNQWEYYVSGADSYGFPNKMPVAVRGDRELEDKQQIDLPWLDKSKGNFVVNIYNFDVPRYNPYDY